MTPDPHLDHIERRLDELDAQLGAMNFSINMLLIMSAACVGIALHFAVHH